MLRRVAVVSLALGLLACGRVSAPTPSDGRPRAAGTQPISIAAEAHEVEAELGDRPALTLAFEAEANTVEHSLSLIQAGARGTWEVRINDRRIGRLYRHAGTMRSHFVVPAATLDDAKNELSLVPAEAGARVSIRAVELHRAPLAEALGLGEVEVEVRDAEGGAGLPARVSIVDEHGWLVGILTADQGDFAIRPGVAYVGSKGRRLGLPAGDYELLVTRGMEWSLGRAPIHVDPGDKQLARVELRRELDTRGWIAADTHVHTLTHSGHGDASVRERVSSLAGEGVELAVATDHNHHTDYRPLQAELGLGAYYTAVTGNEVTTPNGHFTAFPLSPRTPPPDHEQRDWVKLVAGMRAAGAKVVILNHPHWPSRARGPFGVFGLDPVTGARTKPEPEGQAFTFDGMELVNSTSLDPEPLALVHDWFALLNRGQRLVAVGSSDSHTIGDPVGQGRCYVPSATDVASEIDVDAVTQAYLDGRVSVALGIFADLRLGPGDEEDGAQARPGDTLELSGHSPGAKVPVRVRVAAPGWIRPREVVVFVNGIEGARVAVPDSAEAGGAVDRWLDAELELPGYDSYVVAVVVGDGVELPGWPLMADYTFAATNPVYVEGDGEAGWTAPGAKANAQRRATHSHASDED